MNPRTSILSHPSRSVSIAEYLDASAIRSSTRSHHCVFWTDRREPGQLLFSVPQRGFDRVHEQLISALSAVLHYPSGLRVQRGCVDDRVIVLAAVVADQPQRKRVRGGN